MEISERVGQTKDKFTLVCVLYDYIRSADLPRETISTEGKAPIIRITKEGKGRYYQIIREAVHVFNDTHHFQVDYEEVVDILSELADMFARQGMREANGEK